MVKMRRVDSFDSGKECGEELTASLNLLGLCNAGFMAYTCSAQGVEGGNRQKHVVGVVK